MILPIKAQSRIKAHYKPTSKVRLSISCWLTLGFACDFGAGVFVADKPVVFLAPVDAEVVLDFEATADFAGTVRFCSPEAPVERGGAALESTIGMIPSRSASASYSCPL